MIIFVSVVLTGRYSINILCHILNSFLMMKKGEKKKMMVSIHIDTGMCFYFILYLPSIVCHHQKEEIADSKGHILILIITNNMISIIYEMVK